MKRIYVLLLILIACGPKETIDRAQHRKEVDDWHAERVESLKSETGWLNLVGLFWLKEGFNTFGSAEDNDLVFPAGKIAGRAGSFFVTPTSVELQADQDAAILSNGVPVTKLLVYADTMRSEPMEHGSLRWFVIKRDNLIGVRLRDLESDALKNFHGIERYPVEVAYRLEARFEPYQPPKQIDITNILGQTYPQPSPGAVVFKWEGEEYRLDAIDEGGDEYFMIIGDETNKDETYPSGRYMYIAKPDAEGRVILDFNKLYNPPCAFTPFATCPLPPRQNILPIAIKAGEKNYEH